MQSRHRQQLIQLLAEVYPAPRSELDFRNEFELIIAVVLSAQCTDKRVNQVTPALFARFPDFMALGVAPSEEVEELVRTVNYYRTKAKNIRALSAIVTEQFNGYLPRNLADLTTLPGVGRKTANVVLGELGVVPTIAVDTHVFRVARRLGLSTGTKPLAVEQDLMRLFPPQEWRPLHHQLILHGRRVCAARLPQCNRCTLSPLCPAGKKVLAVEKVAPPRARPGRAKTVPPPTTKGTTGTRRRKGLDG